LAIVLVKNVSISRALPRRKKPTLDSSNACTNVTGSVTSGLNRRMEIATTFMEWLLLL
jgi:hypothetical protein